MGQTPKRSFLKTRLGKVVVLGTFSLVLMVVVLELACQAYFYLRVRAEFNYLTTDPRCYWQRSDNPILGFEMRRSINIKVDGRELRVNKHGIRDDSDDLYADKTRIGLIGDSVVFGSGLSQEQSVPAVLQRLVDPEVKSTKILNFGEGGYSLEQMPELMRQRQKVYDAKAVIYLVNPNDFNMRDTIYEGADSGLYKAYHTPIIKSPWFIRKAVYRLVKGKGGDHISPDVGWYTWMFDGCGEALLPRMKEMAEDAKKGGYEFAVVLYPMRAAFQDKDAPMTRESHLLSAEYAKIAEYLKANNIRCFELLPAISGITPNQWMDSTDHFTVDGAVKAAEVFKQVVLDPMLAPAN